MRITPYLVCFTRVINETGQPLELDLHFSADPIAIPNSSDTYVKVFLPADTMTLDKRNLFSYGITELESLHQSTRFKRKLAPKESVLFYVVALFYQDRADAWSQQRGGNRAELMLKGKNALYYRMLPQIDALPCGEVIFDE